MPKFFRVCILFERRPLLGLGRLCPPLFNLTRTTRIPFLSLYPKLLALSSLRGLSTFSIAFDFLQAIILSLRIFLSGDFHASLMKLYIPLLITDLKKNGF